MMSYNYKFIYFSYLYGIVRLPNGEVHPVEKSDLSLPNIAEDRHNMPKKFTLNFSGIFCFIVTGLCVIENIYL